MILRAWQCFVAPGDEYEPLPLRTGIWYAGRRVRFPKEHWERILEFAETVNSPAAQALRSYTDKDDFHYVDLTPRELEALLEFTDELQWRVMTEEPLVPSTSERFYEAFANDEHARMLKAVAAVFRESQRLREPFAVYVDYKRYDEPEPGG